jgi:hypothetical protein
MKTSILMCLIYVILTVTGEYIFLYYIYYSDAAYSSETAGVVGRVAAGAFLGVGGNSSESNSAKENVCLMDYQSERCQKLARTVNATVDLDIDNFGVIVECKWQQLRQQS